MANKKEFVYELVVEVKGPDGKPVEKTIQKTANSIESFEEAVQETEKTLKKAKLGSAEFKKAAKAAKEASKGLDEAKNSSKGLGDQLSSIPGPIGGVIQGIKGFGTALKVLAANPIGLVITAITFAVTALFKAFTSTKKGTEQLQQVTAAFGAGLDVLRDILAGVAENLIAAFSDPKQAVLDLWETIKTNFLNRIKGLVEFLPAVGKAIKQAFSGNFKEAAKTAANAAGKIVLGVENVVEKTGEFIEKTKEVIKEIKNESAAAAALTATLQGIEDRQRALNVQRAEQNALIADAKKRVTDETLSYEERNKALEEAAAAEQNLLNKEIGLAEERLSAKRALAAASDSDAATLDELANLEITLANLREQSINKQKELQDTKKGLNDRQKADMKALADFEKQLNDSLVEDERERQAIELENQRNAQLEQINLLKASEEEKAQLRLTAEEKYLQDKQALEDQYAQEDRDKALSALDVKLELLNMRNQGDLVKLEELLIQKRDLELSNLNLTEDQKLLIITKTDAAIAEAKKAQRDQDMADLDANLAAAAGALGQIGSAFEEGSKAAKAFAISEALINTYLGATKAFTSLSGIPIVGPALGAAAAAAAVVSGLKQVQTIKGTQTPTFADGGIVQGEGGPKEDNITAQLSAGESVINANSTSMFRPMLSLLNQAGGGKRFDGSGAMGTPQPVGGGQSPIIKTYVVANDVTNEQQLKRQEKSRSII